MHRTTAIGLLVFVASALVGFGLTAAAQDKAPAAATSAEIEIDNFTFTPQELTVKAGTTVRWINHDDIPHVVAEKSIAFRSKALDTDDSYTHTFDQAGMIEYFCTLHPHMTGRITVVPN